MSRFENQHPLVLAELAEIDDPFRQFTSIEFLIDNAMKKLIFKRMYQKDTFTKQDESDYDELSRERVRRMQHPRLHRRKDSLSEKVSRSFR